MIKRFLGVLFITGIISIPSLARTVVYGRVTGTNGKPIPVANVFLCHPGNNHPVKSFTVRKDGDYKAIIPTPGIWLLRFTGIFHREYPIAIYAVNGSRSRLDVSLRTYNYGGVFTPAVIGNFSGWSVSKEVPFQKGPDGVAGLHTVSVRGQRPTIAFTGHKTKAGCPPADPLALHPGAGRCRLDTP